MVEGKQTSARDVVLRRWLKQSPPKRHQLAGSVFRPDPRPYLLCLGTHFIVTPYKLPIPGWAWVRCCELIPLLYETLHRL